VECGGVKTLEVPDHLFPALEEMVRKLIEKGADYSVSDDAWASNFHDTADHFDIKPWESCDFNEIQKLSRLKALRQRGRAPVNEPVYDSYLDKANFALLAFALLRHHVIPDTGFVQLSGPHSWSASPDGTGKSAP
jgi:hypothetical protein